MNGHVTVVKSLLAKGSAGDSRDKKKSTPLMLPAMNGHRAVVEILLQACHCDTRSLYRERDAGGQTALTLAVVNGHQAVVEFLRPV